MTGVSITKLLNTGGVAALTYGTEITGVSPTMLHEQRTSAATVILPASGVGKQDLDIALALADESAKQRTDPAFAAHSGNQDYQGWPHL